MEKVSKFKKFTMEHAATWQLIKFTLISSIAGVTEVSSYLLLNSVILKSINSEPFQWWIFNYSGGATGGMGTMIAFLVSTTLAQIVAFITNRKKTFNANNNVIFSATMYAVMVVIIICAQTYLGPVMVTKLNTVIASGDLAGLIGKLIWMFISFWIIFFMSKFVIMRRVEEKQEKVA